MVVGFCGCQGGGLPSKNLVVLFFGEKSDIWLKAKPRKGDIFFLLTLKLLWGEAICKSPYEQ